MSSCAHCGAPLCVEEDECGGYLHCIWCAREYDLNGMPRRMSPAEFEGNLGISSKIRKVY